MFEEEAVENVEEGLVHKVFTAVVEDDDMTTKTMLDEVEVDGVRGVLWEPEDVIGVAKYGQKYQKFVNTLDAPSANGVFEGSVGQDVMYYAVYPYAENQQMSTSLTVKIPTYQTYKHNSFDGSAAPMLAKANDGEALHFKNLCGVLAIRMTGKEKVKSIIFQTNSGEKASGEGVADPDYGDYPVLDMTETSETFIVLDCGEGVQLSGEPTSFHFVLPPATYNGFKLTIATVDGQFMEKSTDKQLNIKRSIVTKAASFAFENTANNITNLSERGHSNCYVVPQSGFYSFDANVIGNGEYGIIEGAGYHTDNPTIAPASVVVLWEDVKGLIKSYIYNIDNGRVSFFADGREGNVLLAAKDADDNILWSWHLWMTDSPKVQLYKNDSGTYEVLDRNIGATRPDRGEGEEWIESMGLLYFWGRKDPFWYENYYQVGGLMTLESSIANPMTRHSTGSWNSRYSSWMGQYNHNPRVWSETQKTIYDPCPMGYRVASNTIFKGFTNTGMLSENPEDFAVSGSFDFGWYFYIDETNDETAWYPVSYYMRWNDGCEKQTNDGYVWASEYTDLPNKEMFHFSSSKVEFGVTQSDGHAYPVRCMKDNSHIDISYPQLIMSGFDNITASSAKVIANIKSEGVSPVIERGFIYGLTEDLSDGIRVVCTDNEEFTLTLLNLSSFTKYYVKAYAKNSRGESESAPISFITRCSDDIIDLSASGTANCYIISKSHTYSFNAVKGNSLENLGDVAFAEVLWETFGTDDLPEVGALVTHILYKDGIILFDVPTFYREGNAVIAAKDISGKILWSWHIWLTDQPEEHIYYDNAGTMMDRNLGATSATPGDVGALGLLYQWGRKDPFLGSSLISSDTMAKSTLAWPSKVSSNSSNGTIEYATSNPITFITKNDNNYDWYYTGSESTDDTRWQSEKTIYDPCPVGWRVPDGGANGVWDLVSFYRTPFDMTNRGVTISISSPSESAWYPASGCYYDYNNNVYNTGYWAYYWSLTPSANMAYYMGFSVNGDLRPTDVSSRAHAMAIRCQKEGTGGGPYESDFPTSGAYDLADSGSANSYIVSSSGTYSIPAVKGNSSESVGPVASAEVLWESFGTDERVFKGSLVSGTKYENGKVYFKTADSYREGNAVIAAKDASGTILWSWHIWLTDEPEGQVYYNNAGTMMDRNLGATSATPGDVGALGLLYQWGRKDPFLSSSSISSNTEAKSTITWPSVVSSNSSNGTIEYATSHPTTFITYNSSNYDWYYTGSSSTDDTRWQSEKTIYDPCPVGWRVPDGGDNGVWSKALGSSSSYTGTYDGTNKGMNFSSKFGDASTIWYPASGCRIDGGGALINVGDRGGYWSVFPSYDLASYLYFNYFGDVYPSYYNYRAYGFGVRCVQE